MTIKKFKEIEFKYNADDLNLEKFIEANNALSKEYKRIDVSSWDVYYTKKNKDDRFIRLRKGDTPELTFKLKIAENIWEREEVDVDLKPKEDQEEKVTRFCEFVGWKWNFKIHKICVIFDYGDYNTVYYTVQDTNLKEIGRFMELEFNKDKVKEYGEDGAFEALKNLEKEVFEKTSISHRNRLKSSLFDMFKKEI